MSSRRVDYVIVGYDFSHIKNEVYTEEWAENQRNQDIWESNKVVGEVQLFSDPYSGNHLYFGYILEVLSYDVEGSNEYGVSSLQTKKFLVDQKLRQTGLSVPKELPRFNLIIVTEWY